MLGVAHAKQPATPFESWAIAVVRHPLDQKCQRALATYRACLRPGETSLIDRALDLNADR